MHGKSASSFRLAVRGFARELVRDEGGQGLVEYILILCVTILGAGALTRAVIGALDKGVLRIGGQLEKDLKTGRAPLGIWKQQ
jgi:hypothetical protein